MSQSGPSYCSKVTFRRERREMELEMIKNIIEYHLSSEESMSDDGIESQLSNSSDDSIPMDSTTSYLPSMNIDDHNEPVSRSIYTLDKDDMLTDDFFDFKSDPSLPLYENARVFVRNTLLS